MKLVNHLDFGKLEARNMVLSVLGTAPATPVVGQGYYDSALLGARYWNGTVFDNKATDSLLLGGQNLTYVLSRANHSGTQTAATISDLATTVQAYRLNQFAVPNGDVAFGGFKITGLADPISAQDAATMGWVQVQVQSSAAGIDAKPSVRLATTTNDTLSGLAARDTITPVAGDRVLVKNQTTASQNGVYIAAAGAWTRAADADQNGELTPGAFWFVEEGSVTQAKTQWRIENTGTIVLGTTAITINQFGAASVYTGSNGILLTGSNFTAVVVASGGLTNGASGLAIDTTIVSRKFSATIGDGTTATLTVTHNLGTQDVVVSVRDASTNAVVLADVTANGVNTVTVGFATAPAANSYRVTVVG